MTTAPWPLALLLCLTAFSGNLLPAQQGEGIPGVGPASSHWTRDEPAGIGMGPVTDELLLDSPTAANWLHFGGNFAGWRHSPIEALDAESLSSLRLAWMLPTGVAIQLETSPVVYDGILYATSSHNRLFALDALSGELLWRYDHKNPSDLRICCGPVNRGVAIAGDLVVMGTLDARLVALDRLSGEIAWNTEIAPYKSGFSVTAAPLVVKDVVVIGVGGGEFGVRGFFDGYDLATGKRRWRHYTVPAKGEPGSETWAGDSNQRGGAPTWASGAYDTTTDTLFWATGNPGPDWNGDEREGDNLYSDSVIAVDPATGRRKWYFQFTPHDVWDYDGNSEMHLVDVEIDGEKVPVLAQANRNGFFYLLDRRDGRYLRASQYVEQLNWGKLDSRGRPIVDPAAMPAENPEQRVCPGLAGGNNGAYSGAYNPDTGLVYVPVIESCMMFQKGMVFFAEGIPFMGGQPLPVDAVAGKAYGHLSAIDPSTGEIRWRYRDPDPMVAGVLSTAGGVVITGNMAGHILGFDAETGEELWRFNAGSTIRSHPIAYELDGRVFVAVGVGGGGVVEQLVGRPPILPDAGVLLVFELPAKAQ